MSPEDLLDTGHCALIGSENKSPPPPYQQNHSNSFTWFYIFFNAHFKFKVSITPPLSEFSRLANVIFILISDFNWEQLPMIFDIKGQVVVVL